MDYYQALRYLDSFLNYEKIGYKRSQSFNLKRMHEICRVFGHPEKSFLSIHVAGTKGKGSIASFISNILKEAGFTVGLYTSPHITNIRERIRINNEMIPEYDLARHVHVIKEKLQSKELGFWPTFFEIYTILAFNYFRENAIDYGVVEVGLGGRLDATNVVDSLVSVISPISYDHTEVLGGNLESIAFEKIGIVKRSTMAVVSAPQQDPCLIVIQKALRPRSAWFVLVGKDINFKEVYHDAEKEVFDIEGILGSYTHCVSYLIGQHQIENAATAVGVVEVLKKNGMQISDRDIKTGIAKTKNPARCELIRRDPYILLDGAQNRASAYALKETLKRNFNYKGLFLILGISKKKDIKGICDELIPMADRIILTKANVERAEEPGTIEEFVKGKNAMLTYSVEEALTKACDMAKIEDMILVTGSFFVVAEAKALLQTCRFRGGLD